jgi:hypothetical protein
MARGHTVGLDRIAESARGLLKRALLLGKAAPLAEPLTVCRENAAPWKRADA